MTARNSVTPGKAFFGMIQIALDQPGRYQKAAIMRDWA
jgi:hypothetical protein